jgi:hypothetical protein
VSSVGDMNAHRLKTLLGPHFKLEVVGTGPAAARQAWARIESEGSQDLLAFGTVADETWQLGRFVRPEVMAELAGEHSASWRSLAVAVLQRLVLDKLLGAKPSLGYVHLLREVTDAVAAKQCQLAVLVPPARMDHVEKIAGNLEKMPPKSTYFYPKLLSGLAFHSLKST